MSRLARWLFVLAIAVAFGLYVWPTRFRYDHMTVDSDDCVVRINRVTGAAQVLLPGEGWTPVEDALGDQSGEPDNTRTSGKHGGAS